MGTVQQRKDSGFTIIEVMIVLAIAGLIMLIVFLAVPALQRNSRNTSLKADAAAVGAAVNEYQSINNGAMPTNAAVASGVITISGAGTAATGKANGATTGGNGAMPTTAGVVNVTFGVKCNAGGTGTGAASTRSAAILYNLETTSGLAPQCTEA